MSPQINKKLLFMKAHWFLKFGGTSFYPFVPAMVRQKGIPESGVGLVWTVTPLIEALTVMVLSPIADAFKIHRLVFLVSMMSLTASFTGVFCAPDIPEQLSQSTYVRRETFLIQCQNTTGTKLTLCSESSTINPYNTSYLEEHSSRDNNQEGKCEVRCLISKLDDSHSRNISDMKCFANKSSGVHESFVAEVMMTLDIATCDDYYDASCVDPCAIRSQESGDNLGLKDLLQMPQFWVIFVCLILMYSSNTSTSNMADTLCLALLEQDRHKYGQQRMWGSLCQGLMGIIGGLLVNQFSKGLSRTNYTPLFIVSLSFFILNILVSSRIKAHILSGKERLKANNIGRLLLSFEMIIFLFSVVVVGMNTGGIWTFLFIIMEDVARDWDPRFSNLKLLQGLMLGVDYILGETIFMFLSPYIIKRLGNRHTFSLVLVAMSIRCLLYSTVTNPWFFLPINLLHGITFGVFVTNMTAYASAMAPKGAEATVQGITKTTFLAGLSLGGLFMGLLLHLLDGLRAFLYTGIFNINFSAFFIVSHWIHNNVVGCGRPEEELRGGASPTAVPQKSFEVKDTTTPDAHHKINHVVDGIDNPSFHL